MSRFPSKFSGTSRFELDAAETSIAHGIIDSVVQDPVDIARDAGVDISQFFQFGDWRDVNFAASNVSGVSFQGSDITGACFPLRPLRSVIETKPRAASSLRVAYEHPRSVELSRSRVTDFDFIAKMSSKNVSFFRNDGKHLPLATKMTRVLYSLLSAPAAKRSREDVARAVWLTDHNGGRTGLQATTELRGAISTSRRLLGSDFLTSTRTNLSVNVERVAVIILDGNEYFSVSERQRLNFDSGMESLGSSPFSSKDDSPHTTVTDRPDVAADSEPD